MRWLPWALLAAAAVMPAQARSQVRTYQQYEYRTSVPGPPRIDFQYRPQWVNVPGTNVQMIRTGQRPPYDMFSYDSMYYIYNNGYWYQSTRWDNAFVHIDISDVPSDLRYVPVSEWYHYPDEWAIDNDNARRDQGGDHTYYEDNGSRDRVYYSGPRVYFRRTPRWVSVPGTRVLVVRDPDRPAYDLFSVGSAYFVYDQSRWYRSYRLNGPYVMISERSVPFEVRNVPPDRWRRYPPTWTTRYESNNRYRYHRRHVYYR